MNHRYLIIFFCVFTYCQVLSAEDVATNTALQSTEQTTDSVARLKENLRKQQKKDSNIVKDSLQSFADTQQPATPAGSIGTMFKGLVLCLGMFFIGLSIYKRLQPRKQIANQQRLQILSKVAITSKSQLVLAELDGREVLIAVGSEHVAIHEPNNSNRTSQPTMEFSDNGKDKLCFEDQLHSA